MAHLLFGFSNPSPAAAESSDKHTVCSHHSTKEKTKVLIDYLVKREHLAAEEPAIFLRSWSRKTKQNKQKKAKRRAEVEMTFIVWLETPNDWEQDAVTHHYMMEHASEFLALRLQGYKCTRRRGVISTFVYSNFTLTVRRARQKLCIAGFTPLSCPLRQICDIVLYK